MKVLNLIANVIQVFGLLALFLILDSLKVHPAVSVPIIFIPILKMARELLIDEHEYIEYNDTENWKSNS